jgi:hypothetical protein
MENIRWANYTPKEWKAVSSLSPEEQHTIYRNLFGDKNTERVKATNATSSELDQLKTLNLDDMPKTLGADPTEDLTTYTEVDPGTYISKTADRVTVTSITRAVDAYIYKDKGVNHFNGNFEHHAKACITSVGGVAGDLVFFWMLANAIEDYIGLKAANESFLAWYTWDFGSSKQMALAELDSGTLYQDPSVALVLNTTYYLTTKRDEGVGTYGTAYFYICTDNYYGLGGTLIDTLTVALHTSKKDFRYIYGVNTHNDAQPTVAVSGWMELLDLQEWVPQTLLKRPNFAPIIAQ